MDNLCGSAFRPTASGEGDVKETPAAGPSTTTRFGPWKPRSEITHATHEGVPGSWLPLFGSQNDTGLLPSVNRSAIPCLSRADSCNRSRLVPLRTATWNCHASGSACASSLSCVANDQMVKLRSDVVRNRRDLQWNNRPRFAITGECAGSHIFPRRELRPIRWLKKSIRIPKSRCSL